MRKLGALVVVVAALVGCHHRGNSHITGGVLGRVVIYRNGVAFYERNATIVDGRVTVRVPRERVDDFLKSLTVVDRATKKPIGVSIPRSQEGDGSFLTMLLETPDLQHAEIMLTYVTEAPAWKPSYRIVVGDNGKVMLEGWAVVDNTTSEDWRGVLVGVGASSALAFRYDLWSVRTVDRDLLQGEEKFAIAPPTGVSPYSDNNVAAEELVSMSGNDVRTGPLPEVSPTPISDKGSTSSTTGALFGVLTDAKTGEKLVGATVVATSPSLVGEQVQITDEHGNYRLPNLPPGQYTLTFYYNSTTVSRSNVAVAVNKSTPVYQKLDAAAGSSGELITIREGVPRIDSQSTQNGVSVGSDYIKNVPVPGRTFETVMGSAAGSQGDGVSFSGSSSTEGQYYVDGVNTTGSRRKAPRKGKVKQAGAGASDFGEFIDQDAVKQRTETSKPQPTTTPAPNAGDEKLAAIVLKVQKDKRDVIVEVHGAPGTEQQAIARGTAVKNKLVDKGIAATKIHVVPKIGNGESDTVRVLAVAPKTATPPPPSRISPGDTPVGESHFIAERPMTVRAGSSAMVAMVHNETTGGVVYLYDPISDRGDKRFAFKSVRLDNPTDDTLEPGPVTVYGDGKFIGEGITEPVPPHAVAVIPFALDKQVVIERNNTEQDQIAKLVTAQRGIVTAEIQHRRDAKFTVTSRLTIPTTVFLRHRLESGWSLLEHPRDFTKVGDSHLFQVDLKPQETKYVTIAEATPVERSFNLASDEGLGMMKVYISDPKASPQLKLQIEALLATYGGAVDLVDKIATLRDQIAEYRGRSQELHAQVLSLKAVRTGGELMVTLRAKLAEMSERTQKATIGVVEAQEKLMLTRVKFQNQLADLRLTDVTKKELSTLAK